MAKQKVTLWINLYRSLLDQHRIEAAAYPSLDLAEKARNYNSCAPTFKVEVEIETTTEPQKLEYATE